MIDNTNFQVIALAIIFDPAERKILIGRRENDYQIPALTWGFPSARLLHGEDIDKKLKGRIKDKTGYEVKNLGAVFGRISPSKEDLFQVFFLCEIFKGKAKVGDDLVELKWVRPQEIEDYFTTPFHPVLKEYINNLK